MSDRDGALERDGLVCGRRPSAGLCDGVLVADKPQGPTSHDVVEQARRLYATKRVGHAGTLDPMATGVLLLLFGEALKLSAYLTHSKKRYRAVIRFGRSTDSLDAEGRTTKSVDVPAEALNAPTLEAALLAERQRREQVPPQLSAIKVRGKPAHRRSRRGEAVVLEPRQVEIELIELRAIAGTAVTLELCVSKGYYVRSLARDLGERLELPAHLEALRRLASGPFEVEEAVSWPPAALPPLLPLPSVVRRVLPTVVLSEAGVARAARGARLDASDFSASSDELSVHTRGLAVGWFAPDGALIALGQADPTGGYRVLRGFRPLGGDRALG